MVKKVGILTLPPIYNYGNILQIYALQYVINDMGYEAVLINRNPQRNRLSYIKNRISVFVAVRGEKRSVSICGQPEKA